MTERLAATNSSFANERAAALGAGSADLAASLKVYKGHPEWRREDYKEQKQLLSKLLSQSGMPLE